tara:strand:- start:3576 stop:3824 length:249 start_codon:yes stop_codon:yes gene_type:complete
MRHLLCRRVSPTNPLQQGLKLQNNVQFTLSHIVSPTNPLQQGLKLNDSLMGTLEALKLVSPTNPLQQGLKRFSRRIEKSMFL